MRFFSLIFSLCIYLSVIAGEDLINIPEARTMSYLKVDTCKIYVEEPDSVGVLQKRLAEIHLINSFGKPAFSYILPKYEDDDTTFIYYEYMNNKLLTKLKIKPGQDTVTTEMLYNYQGILIKKAVTGYDRKVYDIAADEEGYIYGMEVNMMLPEVDSTGEQTDKLVSTRVEEYEYKYNRYQKMVKEIFTYYDKEFHTKIYDYGVTGNGPLLSVLVYKMGEKEPDSKITYEYAANGLIVKETTTMLQAGTEENIYFEYTFKNVQMKVVPAAGNKPGKRN